MRRLVLLVVMVVCGFAPSAAHAQTIDGQPLDVLVDGQGGLQVTFDGQPEPEFVPGQNGLWLRQGASVTPPGKFQALDKPALTQPTPATQRLTSRYQAGEIEITERATATEGEATARLEYTFRNLSPKPVTFSAAELGAVQAAADGDAKGVLDAGPPRAVGGRDRIGRRVALEEQTAFSHYEVDEAKTVRSDFMASGLTDAVNQKLTPYAAAAQWDITLEPDATRDIAVTWRFDLHETVAEVTTTADHDDGSCDKADCTLREALTYLVAGTEVQIPAGTFALTLGQLEIDRDLVLIGQGADKTILDGGGAHRVLEILAGDVDVYRLAFTHGYDAVEGGALRIGSSAMVKLSETAVTDNSAQISAGGIVSYGALSLVQGLVARNVAIEAGGGGIVAAEGGGLSSLSLENVTVSDNRAVNGNGGGIYAGSALFLNASTIAGNVAFAGGGLYRYDGTSRFDRGTLLAANTPSDCGGGTGPLDTKASLSSDASCGVAISGVDPKLGPLAADGGPTQTRALLAGSPAIDAGDPDTCPVVDQRGAVRDTTRCDIGAFERSVTPAPLIATPIDGASVRAHVLAVTGTATPGTVVTLLVDGSEAGQVAAGRGGDWTLTVKISEGDHALTATATPLNGSASPPSEPRGIHVDTEVPAVPAVSGDDTTGGDSFILGGAAEPGAVVTVREGQTVVGTATAGGDGRWSIAVRGAAAGEHTYLVTARDVAGNESAPVARTVRVSAAPEPTPGATATPLPGVRPTPTPTPTPTPSPAPVPNKSVAAETARGIVLVKVGGTFVPLGPSLLANGAEVDARKGAIVLTTAAGEKATFSDGVFKISLSGGITTLTLTEKLDCASKRRARAAAKKPKSRKLWGDGRGKFRTKGSYSAATVRGTVWLTQDTCTTTLIRVKRGAVEVNDLVKHRKILIKAGKSYTARAKRR